MLKRLPSTFPFLTLSSVDRRSFFGKEIPDLQAFPRFNLERFKMYF